MQFAKLFEVDGSQVLCVLAPNDQDGALELRLMTYVGDACVVLGSRALVPGDASGQAPTDAGAAMKLFEGFGHEDARKAYRLAHDLLEEARQQPSRQHRAAAAREIGEGQALVDPDFGVPLASTSVH